MNSNGKTLFESILIKSIFIFLMIVSIFLNVYQYINEKEKILEVKQESNQELDTNKDMLVSKKENTPACPSLPNKDISFECEEKLKLTQEKLNATYLCEERLKIAEKNISKYLPLEDRYKSGVTSPVLESKVNKIINPLLVNYNDEKLDASVNCRDEICEIEVIRKEGQEIKTVLDKLHSDDNLFEMIINYKSYVGVPVRDNLSENVIWKHKIMFEVMK